MSLITSDMRQLAVLAACGKAPFDLLLTHAQIVDMVTGEIRQADVGINHVIGITSLSFAYRHIPGSLGEKAGNYEECCTLSCKHYCL